MKYLMYGILLPVKDEEEITFRLTDLPSLQRYCYDNNDNIISNEKYPIVDLSQNIELMDVEEFIYKLGDLVIEQAKKCKE